MVRASLGRRGGEDGGQKRPSTSAREGPSSKSYRGSYQGSNKPVDSHRDQGYRDNRESISDSRRDSHYMESKQSYRREDHHQIQQSVSRRPANLMDLHHSQPQRYESSSSDHRYQNDGRSRYDQSSSMNGNIHQKTSSFDFGHDRHHSQRNQRDYRGHDGSDHGRDSHLPSSSSHGSGHRRENNHSGENGYSRGNNFNNGSSYGQSNLQSSSRRYSPPRSSHPAQRSGHSPRRLDERPVLSSNRLGRPRTPPELQGRARSPRIRGHMPRPRTPPHHSYSRTQLPQGPRTPTGPRTPQRLHRSTSPQRQRSPIRLEGSRRQKSLERVRSPIRVRSPQRPRASQRQRTPPRNRSPLRPRSPKSPQRQRNSLSPKSHLQESRSPRIARSPKFPSSFARSDRGGSRRDAARHRASPTNRESALKRLGPKMNMTQRLGANQEASQSFGTQKKPDRDNPSSRSPLLTLKCPYCEFSVKSFRDYRVHENSKDHLAAVSKAVDKLEENIKNLRAKQLEEVTSAKPELLEGEDGDKNRGEFCETCQVQPNQTTADHESSILHKSIFEALHPECTICNEKYESSEDFAKHLAVFYHVKKKASESIGSLKDEEPSDENDQDENYFLLDEIMETDIEKLDVSDEPNEVNGISKTEVETEKDNESRLEIKRNKRNAVKEPIVEEPTWGPVGQNFVHKVEMYFCDLCHKYLPRGQGDFQELINSHCVTQLHREKFEKESQASLEEQPVVDEKGDEVSEIVVQNDPPNEELKTATDQAQDTLDDQDEDDTLIIDNQTDL